MVERAGQRQRIREGPVTGPLDRPSQQPLETRKAADHIRPARDAIRFARKTVASIHNAELEILAASQRAARQQAIKAVDAALSACHASTIALVIAKFAARRAALSAIPEPGARAAAAHQLASEETAELTRLALEHAADKRQMRKAAQAPLFDAHRSARRSLRQRQRRQRVVFATQLQALRPRPAVSHPVQRRVRLRPTKALPVGPHKWHSQ